MLTPRLIELHRPLAYHVHTALPPHTFRSGDPVRIEENVSSSGGKGKAKKKADEGNAVEGVVHRVRVTRTAVYPGDDPARANGQVGPEKIIVAVNESKEVDLPERLRLYVIRDTL